MRVPDITVINWQKQQQLYYNNQTINNTFNDIEQPGLLVIKNSTRLFNIILLQ